MVKLTQTSVRRDLKIANVAKEAYTSLYVDGENGLDTYSGDSWEEPLKTIQKAMDDAEAGCKIYVRSMTNSLVDVMAASGQKDVTVDSSVGFTVGDVVILRSINTTERATIASIAGNVLTMTVNLTATYAPVDESIVIHVYNERVEMRSDTKLIGGSADKTIVSSAAGNALTYDSRVDNVEIKFIGAVCNEATYAAIRLHGKSNIVHDCEVDCAGAAGVYGLYSDGWGRCQVWNVRNATPVLDYGITVAVVDNEVYDCVITGVDVGIRLLSSGTSRIHDNRLSSCATGILITGTGDNNVIYHNNLLSNTDQINNTGTGTSNVWFENYYDNHTTDTNRSGLTDTAYTENGETDYKPVSVRAGWKQQSFARDSGGQSILLGLVDSVAVAPTFTVADLAGYGNDYFNGWFAYVVWDKDGGEAAPQGESKAITDYVSSTGTFSHAGFTAVLVAGDKVLISLTDPNASGDATAANQATIIADVTGLAGDAMRGTNSAALASVCTDARLGRLTQDVTVGIKKGVARTIMFKMVDATDFATPETGITVIEKVSKDGGGFLSCTNTFAEVADGWYKILLTATEMNADEIVFKGTGPGCAQCDRLIVTES